MSFDAEKIVTRLRAGFQAGRTESLESRQRHLNDVIRFVTECEKELVEAIHNDFRKVPMEFIVYEIGMVKNEAVGNLNNLKKFMELENRNDGCLVNLGKDLYVQRQPLGVVLIIGAWNYPLQLNFVPLIGAIAAGNVAIVKPSELTPQFSELLEKLIPKYLDNECFQIVNGDAAVTTELLKQRFDHIFYTGSTVVGRIIMKAAAEHLTPVTLELGGKSPTFVDKDCDITTVAKRIVWGKYSNSGQICVAPDYVLCESSIRDTLIRNIGEQITEFFGEDQQKSPDYARIVNDRHFKRVSALLESQRDKIVLGGKIDASERFIAPTVIKDVDYDSPIMQEEIFGPVLPVITVSSVDEAIKFINNREKPLALYVFSDNKDISDRFLKETSSGALTVNDTLMHVGADVLPFGGVGKSGMGCYHGKYSAETFSHRRAYYRDPYYSKTDFLMKLRYPPYTQTKQTRLGQVLRKKTNNELMIYTVLKYAALLAFAAWFLKFMEIDKIISTESIKTAK